MLETNAANEFEIFDGSNSKGPLSTQNTYEDSANQVVLFKTVNSLKIALKVLFTLEFMRFRFYAENKAL
jgi:hypothetical protein